MSEKSKAVEVDLKAKPENAQIARAVRQKGLAGSFYEFVAEWKRQTVLVLGFSGAGKTSMLQYTFGIIEPEVDRERPTAEVRLYMLRLGQAKFRASDTPGHPILRHRLDQEIARLVRGDYQGVIDVVAYGYNQSKHLSYLAQGVEQASLEDYNRYRPLTAAGSVNPDYLKRERELELDYLRSWANLVGTQSKLKWVITVVNKADLWRRQMEKVLNHYQGDGEYAAIIKSEFPDIQHDVCPLNCSVQGFYDLPPSESAPKLEDWRQKLADAFVSTLNRRLS